MNRGMWAVVPAAGRGTRFGGETPKQYLQVGAQPLLAYTLHALFAHPRIVGACVVIAENDADWRVWQARLENLVPGGKQLTTAIGGATRAESVSNGIKALPDDVRADDFVLVHDAARPNVSLPDLSRLIESADAHAIGNAFIGAILAAPVRDTLKRADDNAGVVATESRERLWRAFTPQMFRRTQLADALQAAAEAGIDATDEAMAIERLGLRPLLVEGSEDNLKITTPADLARFKFILSQR